MFCFLLLIYFLYSFFNFFWKWYGMHLKRKRIFEIHRLYVVRVFCEKRHVQRLMDNDIIEVSILDGTTGELLPDYKHIMVLVFMTRMGSLAYCGVLLCNMCGAYARFFKFKVCAISHRFVLFLFCLWTSCDQWIACKVWKVLFLSRLTAVVAIKYCIILSNVSEYSWSKCDLKVRMQSMFYDVIIFQIFPTHPTIWPLWRHKTKLSKKHTRSYPNDIFATAKHNQKICILYCRS